MSYTTRIEALREAHRLTKMTGREMDARTVECEEWRDIQEYENCYQVSSLGRVRSFEFPSGKRRHAPQLVVVQVGKYAAYVMLRRKGSERGLLVRRLVLHAFVEPCPEEMEAINIDRDPSNNRLDNLRWARRGERRRQLPNNGAARRHGMSGSSTYATWESMKARCLNPNNKRFSDYGGRGIAVCERWLGFENFFADMGERPAGTSLDRYPNKDGNYEPGNCRWATPKQQQRNTRSNKILSHNGESKTIVEWSEATGIHRTAISLRLSRGWAVADALTIPVQKRTYKS